MIPHAPLAAAGARTRGCLELFGEGEGAELCRGVAAEAWPRAEFRGGGTGRPAVGVAHGRHLGAERARPALAGARGRCCRPACGGRRCWRTRRTRRTSRVGGGWGSGPGISAGRCSCGSAPFTGAPRALPSRGVDPGGGRSRRPWLACSIRLRSRHRRRVLVAGSRRRPVLRAGSGPVPSWAAPAPPSPGSRRAVKSNQERPGGSAVILLRQLRNYRRKC